MGKPIVVCGIDFSGTSMLAGMLHAAGLDMGKVESVEDVANHDRPIPYRMFEDKRLARRLAPIAPLMKAELPGVSPEWLDLLYDHFMDYIAMRTESASGKPWGVKCNGLLFLSLHRDAKIIPVQWVTTMRPFRDSLASGFKKIGTTPYVASMLSAEYLAWQKLIETDEWCWISTFANMMHAPREEAHSLYMQLLGHREMPSGVLDKMMRVVDSESKGVISWHGLSQ